MIRIHFLNVRNGDCVLFQRHNRLSMIDICCGNLGKDDLSKTVIAEGQIKKPRGNYKMCDRPTNPIDYMNSFNFTSIWRFILTHPDMDHMDGLKRLSESINIQHFWDCGIRRDKPVFDEASPYSQEDWGYYQDLIGGKIEETRVIGPRAGDRGKFWNADDDENNGSGDDLHIVSPSEKLVDLANNNGDINDASYVLVYRSSAGNVVFAGDSNNKTWDYIIEEHKDLVKDAGLLFAPHHGRKSDRDYSFLDIVKPRISFFGCAPSEHLAYSAWQYRDLLYFTNNQCGNVHIDPVGSKFRVFIENYNYAADYTRNNTYKQNGYWFLCEI